MTTALFVVTAAAALAAGVWTIAARTTVTAVRALRLCVLAAACAYAQVMATLPAVLLAVVIAGAAGPLLAGLAARAEGLPAEPLGWRIAGLALLTGLALVLVGTWARQYVWTGRELAPGSGFGTAAEVGAALAGPYAPTLVAGLMVLAAAAIAGSQRAAHRL
jgi:NADH:ubiquinone oxidoreductase subunit 6 (subunit J)